MAYQTNTEVEWDWGEGVARGYVREVYREPIDLEIKGTTVTRDASENDPAYRIEQADGDEVLKLHSEVREAA